MNISFRQITLDDIPIMHAWFNKVHVQKFYSLRSWTEIEVLNKLLPNIEHKKPLYGFIALLDGSPIGYLQYCQVKDFPWLEQEFESEVVENAAGLDFFIGELEWTGKGLGSKIIEYFLNTMIWPNFKFCVVDPDVQNLQSIKMFEKCGFSRHKIIASIDALGKTVKLLLMIKSRSNFYPLQESFNKK